MITRNNLSRILILVCCLWQAAPLHAAPAARIYEEPLVIPTYGVAEPDYNPRFYIDRTYQGAQGRVYPYPMSDVLTNKPADKTYNAVYLENNYIKICVLPEIGGRIFSALDKTSNYDFFYRQSVIKPSLIGMLGAWISGGVEWNFPHHHRSRTFMPTEYEIKHNPDGSKTLWLGELERRHRMRLLLGLTVHPDKSYIELETRIFNRTPVVNSFLYFANPAVHVDDTYQVLFPPGTQYVTQHAKKEFAQWPVADCRYGGKNYDNVDISWWKNLTKPVSFFAWNYDADFFAGYDHGKQAGVAYVANHHIAPGKKFFTFGCGDQGIMWDKMLTDSDGPYLELMAGAYSDNQPDYSWAQPYEVKVVKQYWFPIRRLQDMKFANLNGALNLQLDDQNRVIIEINTTSPQTAARLTLTAGNQTAFNETVSVGPDRPFSRVVGVADNTKPTDLKLTLKSSDGEILLDCEPKEYDPTPMPEPVRPPASPRDIKTVEELYLAGLRLDQFHNPKLDPYDYYEEALRRDPHDYRVNTHLGILYCKRGMFTRAEERLKIAIERAIKNYTSPKDGEALYYLGHALKSQGKYEAAYDSFYKATWSLAWHTAAYFSLAQIDCIKGDYTRAMDHLNRALTTGTLNTKALNLKAAVLRKKGRLEKALAITSQALAIDPLDPWALNELYLAQLALGLKDHAEKQLKKFQTKTAHDEQLSLELAVDYGNCAFWTEAIDVLSRLAKRPDNSGSSHPMLYYYLAHFHQAKGSSQKANAYYALAAQMPPDYCFPFRTESIEVLRRAQQHNPKDHLAPCYLGNLLYDVQPEAAVKQWQKSRQINDTFYLVHRNLAFAHSHTQSDLPAAIASLEKAVECNNRDPRLFYELDRLYETANTDPAKRLQLLDKNSETVAKRDDSLTRRIILQVRVGQYDKAIQTLKENHFNKWEGGGRIHDVYVDAFRLRARQRFEKDDYRGALEDLTAALEYPDNLEVGRPEFDEQALTTYYLMAAAHEGLGDIEKALEYCKKSVAAKTDDPRVRHFQALAHIKLNQLDQAAEIFTDLRKIGTQRLRQTETAEDFFAKFGEKQSRNNRLAEAHYIAALGALGTTDNQQLAKTHLTKALELNINHTWASVMLAGLEE